MISAPDQSDKTTPGKLGAYVQGLLEGSELPMFSRQLVQLLALSLEESAAARKLVELVGEDYGLTCKVLQISNSYRYNRSNRPIESLTHAIVVLGAGTVQNLASTLACFQASEKRSTTLQQLMIRSMVSAEVAAATAQHSGIGDREVAYLAGMLQNLGEVLVAHHSPARHTAIQEHVEAGRSRDAAGVMELGFTFEELSRVVGRHWKLSQAVCSLWDSGTASTDITSLARFANELTRIMCQSSESHRSAGITLLLMRYSWTLSLTKEVIVEMWGRALKNAGETFDTLGMSLGSLNLPVANMPPSDHLEGPSQHATA